MIAHAHAVFRIPAPGRTLSCALLAAAMLLLPSASLVAALASEENLIEHSPFLPPGWGRSTAPPPPVETPSPPGALSRELEFRGIFEMNGVPKFSIFDKTEQRSAWHSVGGSDARFSVVSYDIPKRTVTVRAGGRTEELQLAKPDDRAVPVVGSTPGGTPPTPPPNFTPPTAPPTAPPTSQPPSNIPPPPPGVNVQGRSGGTTGSGSASTAIPRRRVLRPSESARSGGSSTGGEASTSQSTGGSMPPPPNFVPGPPPNIVPPPLPTQ